jgi:hypothetical protein
VRALLLDSFSLPWSSSDDERGRNPSASQAVHMKEQEELASLERAHAALQDEVKRSEAALQAFGAFATLCVTLRCDPIPMSCSALRVSIALCRIDDVGFPLVLRMACSEKF